MLDIAAELHQWCEEGRDFAVATVVAVGGSAPRQPGAALAVDSDGEAVGSVSGGCVEGAVYELCRQALEDGLPVTERFGYSDEDAFAVGLTCGGVIDVLVVPVTAASGEQSADGQGAAAGAGSPPAGEAGAGPAVKAGVRPAEGPGARSAEPHVRASVRGTVAEAVAAVAQGETAALVRVTDGPAHLLGGTLHVRPDGSHTGTLGGHPGLDATAAAEARALLEAGRTAPVTVGEEGSRCGSPVTLLVECRVPAPRMLVFGAIDFASALVRAGRFLGFRVTVCDARPVFATAARFPDADEIVVDWPHRYLDAQHRDGLLDSRTVVCVLTHDAKFDVPLLERALRLPVAYVGAMGSRRTHEDRLRRLRDAGLTERELARLHSPIGLDLGARTPEETALSIAAEVVAVRHAGSGTPLTGAHTPIHHERGQATGRIGSVA